LRRHEVVFLIVDFFTYQILSIVSCMITNWEWKNFFNI
jgi:hypothetical protein